MLNSDLTKYIFYCCVVAVLVMAATLYSFRYYLETATKDFGTSFYSQNIDEFNSGQVYILANRLMDTLANLNWRCVKLTSRNKVVINSQRGHCDNLLFNSKFILNHKMGTKIDMEVSFTYSSTIKVLATIVISIQLLLLIIGYLLIYRLQSKLIKSERQKTVFQKQISRIVAHDLKSPLSALRITLGFKLNQITDAHLNLASNAISKIEDIADSILDERKISSSTQELTPLHTNIQKLLSEKRLEHSKLESFSIKLDCPPKTLLSKDLFNNLSRHLSNLINNSCEARHSSRPLQISIKVKRTKNDLIIYVADNGKGISRQILSRLNSGETLSYGKIESHGSGFGIGISSARSWAETNGGSLTLSSKENYGSTVTLRFKI